MNAFLKDRIAIPTRKYPGGSAFAARAASVSLKRFASFLSAEGILADRNGGSVLAHVRRTKVDEDVPPGQRDHALVVFLAGAGLRSNEAREARIHDLDLAACTLAVRPETSKFGRGRTVQFHPAVGRELDRYLRSRSDHGHDAPLFPTDAGNPFTVEGWEKVFQRIRARSGVRVFCAHVLRHT